ncbi:MAG: antibiotic biosynthesis monooxygenase [Eubacteriales bacterium]|nr:antibiotic biosynthesis monooxygenase [Clostridiales bacterium]MDD7594015.1 antibiotic biosynthesis monooxygenase [Clostridiales bacterium]MDY4887887.1 antibiotic biosynthesis monooxygenase [Eubacteriales bacterium]MDY5859668.1 antibiotic biosynthesis monooxygenase [Eubacteriales bacterium]
MLATLVFVDVKPECVDAFKKISCYNHDNSRLEPGNVRFDVLQSREDPTQFVLYEVYVDEAAAAEHKKTEHYLRWREEVAPYMNSPRRAIPTTPAAFD